MREHLVEDGVRDTPVFAYLRRAFPLLPAFALREALKKRDVRVNGARSGAEATVRGGDRLRLYIDEKFFSGSLRVLFQDAGLLVVEKPQGLPVDADEAGIGADTLLSRARTAHPSARLCHRLDSGVGGVVLLSLDPETHEAILRAFREETLEKRYALCAVGNVEKQEGRLVHYIRKDAAMSLVQTFDSPVPGAKRAELLYRRLGAFESKGVPLSVLEVELHTGRTHQIRAQMAHIGRPIAGDDKYGDRAVNAALHARMPSLWCVRMALFGDALPPRYRGMAFESAPGFPLFREAPQTIKDGLPHA